MILRTNGDSTLIRSTKSSRDRAGSKGNGGNDLDGILNFLVKFPRPVLRLFATVLNILEYYSCMPKSLSAVILIIRRY